MKVFDLIDLAVTVVVFVVADLGLRARQAGTPDAVFALLFALATGVDTGAAGGGLTGAPFVVNTVLDAGAAAVFAGAGSFGVTRTPLALAADL